ncbi:MAG: hypothetical protein IKU38_10110 [Clostridia bacterium]|nr:hypothetical protein [Clostridia bacterium]
MIEASFERDCRSAAVSGAYQYDTGQRLRMHGLPSPQELAVEDELLSGDMVMMQVHFGLKGNSQTKASLALWEEESGCWMAAIPDEYLQTAQNVYAYVYVSYGMDESGNARSKTMYELVFRPVSRPAPDNLATEEQWEAWAIKKEETQLAIDTLEMAKENALKAEENAKTAMQDGASSTRQAQLAGQEAQAQVQRLENIQMQWNGITVYISELQAGLPATASIQQGRLVLGVPSGADGPKGETGEDGPSNYAFYMDSGVLIIEPKA